MCQSVFRCFNRWKFLEDFFFHSSWTTRAKRNTHVEPPPHFSMTHPGPLWDPLEWFLRRSWGEIPAQWVADPSSPYSPRFVSARARSRQPKNHHSHSISYHHQKQTPISSDSCIHPKAADAMSREDGKSHTIASTQSAREFGNLDGRDIGPSDRSRRIPASDGRTSRGKSPSVLKSENVHEVRKSRKERYSVKMLKRRWWAGPSWQDPPTPPVITRTRRLILLFGDMKISKVFLQKWF